MIDQFVKTFLTMFGVGYFKYAPGTAASLITCLIYLLINKHFVLIYFVIFLIIVSIYSIILINKIYKKKDAKEIVIDEFIGQSIPICLYEIAHNEPTNPARVITFYFIMFILFRIFDITKPYPVSYYDKNFKNSFGVIMDDVCAGLYVVAILVFYMIITT